MNNTDERIKELISQRDAAIKILAEWCVAIERNGTGWDDWDEYYKDAKYRPTDPPELRKMLDAAMELEKKRNEEWYDDVETNS